MTQSRPPIGKRNRWGDWVEHAFDRQLDASMVALVLTWTGAAFALWLAAIGAVLGAVTGIFGGLNIGLAQELHLSQATGLLAAVAGLFVGAFGGFLIIYAAAISNPLTIAGDIVGGTIVALATLVIITQFEDVFLRMRGYRALSKREHQLIDPMLDDILARMDISGSRPNLYMSDHEKPEAWAYPRSIVLAKGLLDYTDSSSPPTPRMDHAALASILAHELAHWKNADALATRVVWSCFWPLVAVHNLSALMRKHSGRFGWLWMFVFWPATVSVRYIVAPLMSEGQRQSEYQADWTAAALGEDLRLGLRRALHALKDWEAPRTGWEQVIVATHPPIEHRLERLDAPIPVGMRHAVKWGPLAEGNAHFGFSSDAVRAAMAYQAEAQQAYESAVERGGKAAAAAEDRAWTQAVVALLDTMIRDIDSYNFDRLRPDAYPPEIMRDKLVADMQRVRSYLGESDQAAIGPETDSDSASLTPTAPPEHRTGLRPRKRPGTPSRDASTDTTPATSTRPRTSSAPAPRPDPAASEPSKPLDGPPPDRPAPDPIPAAEPPAIEAVPAIETLTNDASLRWLMDPGDTGAASSSSDNNPPDRAP